jgi:integrase
MGAKVRMKGKNWYVFVNFKGERAATKCRDEDHAIDVAKAVTSAIASRQFNIANIGNQKSERKPDSPTLREFYEHDDEHDVSKRWEGSLARNTYKSFDVSLRVHIFPVIGDLPLTKITRKTVKNLVTTLQKKETATKTPRLLSKSTIRNALAALRACMNEAIEDEWITINPATRHGKTLKNTADFREEIDPFTRDEVALLLETMRDHFGFENYALLLTLFHTGVRAGEAAGLFWSDFDIRNKTLIVRRQFTRGLKAKPKTRKSRSVDVSTILLGELQTLKKAPARMACFRQERDPRRDLFEPR